MHQSCALMVGVPVFYILYFFLYFFLNIFLGETRRWAHKKRTTMLVLYVCKPAERGVVFHLCPYLKRAPLRHLKGPLTDKKSSYHSALSWWTIALTLARIEIQTLPSTQKVCTDSDIFSFVYRVRKKECKVWNTMCKCLERLSC